MDKTAAFIDQIRWLHEVDYGDFKRKVGLYILRLESSLDPSQKKSVKDLITQMRHEVLYQSHEDVEQTRQSTLKLAEQIHSRLHVRH